MTGPRRAGFVAVGSEMLRAGRVETNSHLVARLLAPAGIRLAESRCVEDDEAAIAGAVADLAQRLPLVLVSGGLGPTADDVTREALAGLVNRPLVTDPDLLEYLTERFRSRGRELPAPARRMAHVIPGAEVLANPEGTAPGMLLEVGSATVVLLPGVPRELETIVCLHLLPRWQGGHPVLLRTLHLGGVYESDVEKRIAPLYGRFGRQSVTILAGRGTVDVILSADGGEAAQRLAEMDAAFAAAAGADLAGRDGSGLEETVVRLLGERGWLLATAESCTGGLIGGRVTGVPGASRVYVGGVVSYADDLKEHLLGVPAAALARDGAVSESVARSMARGAIRLGAQCAVAVTGVAGPGGGSEAKPVGTVHVAVVTPEREQHRQFRFPGSRERVRAFAATFALDLLRRVLAGEG